MTVVILDRHRLFARGLEALLDHMTGGQVLVVGHTADADDAASLTRRHQPRLAIVDLDLAPPGGRAAISAIRHQDPRVRVAALAGDDDPDVATPALRAGAHGVLLRSADPDTLVAPLLAMACGLSVVTTTLMGSILGTASPRHHPEALSRLSPQDLHLWRLVAEARETAEIAQRLFVSERTAKRRVALLLRRLGVANRVQAAALAGQSGLLDPDRRR